MFIKLFKLIGSIKSKQPAIHNYDIKLLIHIYFDGSIEKFVNFLYDDNYKDESNPFYELVNLGSNSTYFKQLRNTDIQYAASPANLKTYNKQRVALTMPDCSEINTNVPVALHQSYGCQMVCMNYQNLDKNMKYYLDFFNNAGCAFVKKPPYLCYVQKKITCATPPSKDLSFAPKKYEVLPGMSIHM